MHLRQTGSCLQQCLMYSSFSFRMNAFEAIEAWAVHQPNQFQAQPEALDYKCHVHKNRTWKTVQKNQ